MRSMWLAGLAVGLLSGCAGSGVHSPHGGGSHGFTDEDDTTLTLVSTADMRGSSASWRDCVAWHWPEGADPQTGSLSGEVFRCGSYARYRGTWRDGQPRGPLELFFGDFTRFVGEVADDGQVAGTLYALGTDRRESRSGLRMALTEIGLSDEAKAEIRRKLATADEGEVVVPVFTGTFRRAEGKDHEPARGIWYQARLSDAKIESWTAGERSADGWEGQVDHYVATGGRTYDPAELEGQREWSRGYRAGQPHGEWIEYQGGSPQQTVTYVDGKRHGLTREFGRDGEVVAEIPYEDDAPRGTGWRLVRGERWTLEHVVPGLTVATIPHTEGPLASTSFVLEPREPGAPIQGWVCQTPREGKPYLVFVDLEGREIEKTRRALPHGCQRLADVYLGERFAVSSFRDGSVWVGQTIGGRSPRGWGRMYLDWGGEKRGSQRRFVEGYWDQDGQSQFTLYAEGLGRRGVYTVLELRFEGRALAAEPGELALYHASEARAVEKAEREAREAREARAEAKRQESLERAVLRRPLDYTPRLDPEAGVVRWSNGAVTRGKPIKDIRYLSRGDVVWIDTGRSYGFLRVVQGTQRGLLLHGVGEVVVGPETRIAVFEELSTPSYRKRFGEACFLCDGRGFFVATRHQNRDRRVEVRYVDGAGHTVRTSSEIWGSTELVDEKRDCSECGGAGSDLGSWGSWQTRRP